MITLEQAPSAKRRIHCDFWQDAEIYQGGKCRLGKFGGVPSYGICENHCPLMVIRKDLLHDQKEVAKQRDDLAAAIANRPAYPGTFKGRGIVMPAGGPRYFTCAWVNVALLRDLGCTLPIEIWYLGRNEMDDEMIQLMSNLGATCVDATKYLGCPNKPFVLKPFAILHSSFEEVLYIDADNYAISDPTHFFEALPYQDNGCLFWPDLCRMTDPRIFRAIGLPPFGVEEPEFESGAMLIDKRACWTALHATMHMNYANGFYYSYMYGDKDTFRLGWQVVGKGYAVAPKLPEKRGTPILVQYGLDGRPAFEHRCGPSHKWNANEDEARADGMTHHETLNELIELLRRQWGGFVMPPLEGTDAGERN